MWWSLWFFFKLCFDVLLFYVHCFSLYTYTRCTVLQLILYLLPPARRLCFHLCLFVYLFVNNIKPHSHCAQSRRLCLFYLFILLTAQHCAEPRRTALIDYMEINCSIHTESISAQYCATCSALLALGANKAAKCSAVVRRTAHGVNGQRSAAPSCPHYARHVIHEY